MVDQGARLTAVCVVHALIPGPKDVGVTAIDKRPAGFGVAVEVGPLGLAGDRVCDTGHHGGEEQAIYAYADEDAAWWAAELDRAYLAVLAPGRLAAGDEVVVERRPVHGVTIRDVFLDGGADAARRLLEADGVDGFVLGPKVRAATEWLARRGTGA